MGRKSKEMGIKPTNCVEAQKVVEGQMEMIEATIVVSVRRWWM
jgi:hypothetical protein